MRILLLAQWYEPIIGGEETHVRALARTLVALGHEVAVATLSHPARPALSLDGGVRIHRIEAAIQRLPARCSQPRRDSPQLPCLTLCWPGACDEYYDENDQTSSTLTTGSSIRTCRSRTRQSH